MVKRAAARPSSPVPTSGIAARAAELVRLQEALKRAYRSRDGSGARDRAWASAAERFQDAVKEFYAPFDGLGRSIRGGGREAVETAVRYLEVDPWCFRSGYVKADLMDALANAPLAPEDRRRLQAVVLHRLRAPEPRLLRPTCRLATNVWDEGLARDMEQMIAGGSEAERAGALAVQRAVEHKERTVAGERAAGGRQLRVYR